MMTFFVSQGTSLNAQCNFGNTPLHNAFSEGRKDVALMLIERGANVTEKGSYGKTPVDLAHEKCHMELIELLSFGEK